MWKRVETDAEVMGGGKRLSRNKVKETTGQRF